MQDILVAPFRGVVDAFLERALEVRDRFGATPKPHLGTQIVAPALT